MSAAAFAWVARASRVLASASRDRELYYRVPKFDDAFTNCASRKVRRGGTPQPARETRALPGGIARRAAR